MSATELRKKLIEKISVTENEELLGEAYRLLEMETADMGIYKLNDQQIAAISEAKDQIRNGEFLSNEEADREIDSWLKK